MAKAKRPRTDAQAEAEARYAAKTETIQVSVKFKTGDDLKMFKRLRKRFEGASDSSIVRTALRELDTKKN